MLKKPDRFESKYFSGLEIEYLTPACAPKWIIISNLFFLNNLFKILSLEKSIFWNLKLLLLFKIDNLFFLEQQNSNY